MSFALCFPVHFKGCILPFTIRDQPTWWEDCSLTQGSFNLISSVLLWDRGMSTAIVSTHAYNELTFFVYRVLWLSLQRWLLSWNLLASEIYFSFFSWRSWYICWSTCTSLEACRLVHDSPIFRWSVTFSVSTLMARFFKMLLQGRITLLSFQIAIVYKRQSLISKSTTS